MAFEQVLRSWSLVDRNDPLTEPVARKIVEIGATGIHDAATISEIALKQLKASL